MKMLLVRTLFCFVCLEIGSAFAQNSPQRSPMPAEVHVISVELGHSSGLCGGSGYCSSETVVRPFYVLNKLMDSTDNKKFPNQTVRRSITHREWKVLTAAIDPKSLTLSGIACHPEVDEPCSWVRVKFNDNSQISVFYNNAQPPAPISKLLRYIPSTLVNLRPGKGIAVHRQRGKSPL